MRKIRIFMLALLIIFVFLGCVSNPTAQEMMDRQVGAGQLEQSVSMTAVPSPAPEKSPPAAARAAEGPKIQFDSQVFDFGKLDAGEQIAHVFTFKNTGGEVLIIEKVRSS